MNIFTICKATMKKTKSQEQLCIHCFRIEPRIWSVTKKYYSLHLPATFKVGHFQFSHIHYLLPATYHCVTIKLVKTLVSSFFVFMYSAFKNHKNTSQAFAQVCDVCSLCFKIEHYLSPQGPVCPRKCHWAQRKASPGC